MDSLAVVVAAHPDDEVLSAGALLTRLKDKGFRVHLLWITHGEGSVSPDATGRPAEAVQVATKLDASFQILARLSDGKIDPHFRDTKLDSRELVPAIDGVLKALRPRIVLWPFGLSSRQNSDHIQVHEAMENISNRWEYGRTVWLAGQPPVDPDPAFRPGLFLPYGAEVLARVQELMEMYASERGKGFSDPAFARSRAESWAYIGRTGTLCAEPFLHVKGSVPTDLFEGREIEFFRTADGGSPIQQFLRSLSATEEIQAIRLVNQLREHGHGLPAPFSQPLGSGVRALMLSLRPRTIQVFYFGTSDSHFVLLHAAAGASEEVLEQDLRIAIARKKEWLADNAKE